MFIRSFFFQSLIIFCDIFLQNFFGKFLVILRRQHNTLKKKMRGFKSTLSPTNKQTVITFSYHEIILFKISCDNFHNLGFSPIDRKNHISFVFTFCFINDFINIHQPLICQFFSGISVIKNSGKFFENFLYHLTITPP